MGTEYHVTIDDGLRRGLKPYQGSMRNSELLTQATNVEIRETGLVGLEDIENPFASYPEVVSYPFPQLFIGKGVTLLVYETSIYSVDMSPGVGSWTTTLLTVWDALDISLEKVIPAGEEPWQFIDMHDFWYLSSSKGILFKVHKDGMFTGGSDKVFFTSDFVSTAGCFHRGRVVLGGFVKSEFWNTTWGSLFTYWLGNLPAEFNPDFDIDIDAPGENWVMWSSIGGGDVPLMFIYPEFVMTPGVVGGTSGYGEAEPYIFQALRRNELGWAPLPFQGEVLSLKSLGKNVVAYCEKGVALLTQVSSPFPTFGIEVLSEIGIIDKSAVAGDEKEHVYVDAKGAIHRVTNQGDQRLGYEDFLSDYLTNTIFVNFEPDRRRFYITTGSTDIVDKDNAVFILNSQGLSGCSSFIKVSSVNHIDGSLIGVFTDPISLYYKSVDIITEVLEMKYRGEKMITHVDLAMKHNSLYDVVDNAYVYILAKSGGDDSFTQYGPYAINEYGVCPDIRISGNEIKVRIYLTSTSGNAYVDFELDRIDVWYEITDKRWRRGI